MANIRKTLVFAAIAFAVTFALFLPSARYELVDIDDSDYIIKNEHMRDGLTVANVTWAVTNRSHSANWHPLTWISLMADVTVVRAMRGGAPFSDEEWKNYGGRRANVMHFHNVVIHAANATLLFLLIVILLNRLGGGAGETPPPQSLHSSLFSHPSSLVPLAFSLLWAVHPLRVEAVCWVTERKELLSVFWMLLCLIFYFRGSTSVTPHSALRTPHSALRTPRIAPASRLPSVGGYSHSALFYLFSLLSYLFALLSKPVAVSLPAIILAWDWLFGGRVRWRRLLPFVALALATCVFTMHAQEEARLSGSSLSMASRLSTFFVSPLIYIRQTFWPFGLSVEYANTTQLNLLAFAGGVLLVLVIVGVCVLWLVRRVRRSALCTPHTPHSARFAAPYGRGIPALDYLVFAIAWVYGGLLPMLGIVKAGMDEHNDRFTYWAGCGVVAMLAVAFERLVPVIHELVKRTSGERADSDCESLSKMCKWTTLVVLVLLFGISWQRMPVWHDTIALYRDAIPKCWDTEMANVIGHKLQKLGPEGVKEGEYYHRGCVTHRSSVPAALNFAAFMLFYAHEDGFGSQFGGGAYAEAEVLIKGVLAIEPKNEKALDLQKLLKMKRGEKVE